ncbi:MAG: 16S rRNA (adenine(1518)-N(6)/adenine(1519)-N(6))-dimethyltransferase RsmA [Christensenellaceae bacterium]
MKINEVLKKNDFRFNKKFGQNFITDGNLLDMIVEKSEIGNEDVVIEIGCGAGTLTSAIAKKAKRVIGFEIDENLRPVLDETLSGYDNIEIVYKDVMKVSDDEIKTLAGGRFSLIANLPYYITTPIIMRFAEDFECVKRIVVTVQEEVADRLCAKAGSPEYGAITAGIDAVGTCEKVLRIDRKMFFPSPNVDSAVVKIDIDRNKYGIEDIKAYRAGVRSAFSSRRKTLANNLMMSFGFSRREAEEIVLTVKSDVMARGETLTTADFVKLSEELSKRNIKL